MSEFIEFLTPTALKDLQTANAELVKMVANVDTVGKKMKGISTPSGGDSAVKSLTAEYQKQEKVIQSLQAKLQKASEQNVKNAERQRLAEIKLAQDREKAFDKFEVQSKKEQDALIKSENLYNKVQAKINALIPQYNSLATKKELGIKLTDEEARKLEFLTGKVLGYENALKRVDSNRGKFTREVGNYSKATENLNRSLTTIATEIPNFFQSVTIGLRSISNNIQPVRDGLKGVKKEANDLGKEAPNAFMSIIKGLVNWQSVLFIGIGLLTAYGEEIWNWTKALFSGSEALTEIYKIQDDFNKARLQSSAKTKQEVENLKEYIKIAKNASGAFTPEQTESAFEVLRRAGKGYFEDLKNTEIFGKKGEKALKEFTKAIEAQAKAEDLLSANKKTNERINELQSEVDARKKYVQDQKDLIDSLANKQITYDQYVKKRNDLRYAEEERRSRRSKLEDKLLVEATEKGNEYRLKQSVYEEKSVKLSTTLALLREEEAKQRIKINDELDKSVVLEGKIDKKTENKKEKIALNFKEVESEYALRIAILERKKAEANDIMNNDANSLDTRLKARKNFSEKSIELLDLQLQKERALLADKANDDIAKNELALKNKDISNRQYYKNIEDINKRLNNELLTVDEKHYANLQQLYNEDLSYYKKIEEEKKAFSEKTRKSIIDNELEKFKKVSENEKATLKTRQSAFDEYLKISKKELDISKIKELANAKSTEEIDNIINKYKQLERQLDEIATPTQKAKEEFDKWISSISSGQLEKSLQDIGFSSAKMFLDFDAHGQSTFSKMWDLAETTKEKFALAFKAIGDIAKDAFAFIEQQQQKQFESQYARLEQEKEIALMFAGESATAREEIERQYDERRKRIQRQEAQSKKKLAIFNTIINTAQGVVSALAMSPPNIPLSIAIGVIGAIQTAMISAQQIPQFAKGTDNAPEGLAWTQEKGREIITDKHGKIKSLGSDKGAQMTYLNKGDKVFKNADTEAMLFNNELNGILMNNGINQPIVNVNQPILIDTKGIIDAIDNKVGLELNFDANGFSKYKKQQGQRRELVNNRLNTKTFNI